jgi:hypothetical protein
MEGVWQEFAGSLPPSLRACAATLPFQLGLSSDPRAGWDAYAHLDPIRELPGFAIEPLVAGKAISDAAHLQGQLPSYRIAHWHGGFFGVLADRLVDGQDRHAHTSDEDGDPAALLAPVQEAWRRALAAATGRRAVADAAIDRAIAAWARGLHRELRARERGSLSVADYVAMTGLKVSWLATAAQCLLEQAGERERAWELSRAFELLLLAAQCLDDAIDADEDERLHGASLPTLLGLGPGALVRAAPPILLLAARRAESGFPRFSSWLSAHAERVRRFPAPGDAARDALGALALMEAARTAALAAPGDP